MGETELETTPDIIKLYNPMGTGSVDYFFYRGIMVYPRGSREKVGTTLTQQIGQVTHGTKEGVVEGFR